MIPQDIVDIASAAARRGPGPMSEAERSALAMCAGVGYQQRLRDDGMAEFVTDTCGVEWVGDRLNIVTMRPQRRSGWRVG